VVRPAAGLRGLLVGLGRERRVLAVGGSREVIVEPRAERLAEIAAGRDRLLQLLQDLERLAGVLLAAGVDQYAGRLDEAGLREVGIGLRVLLGLVPQLLPGLGVEALPILLVLLDLLEHDRGDRLRGLGHRGALVDELDVLDRERLHAHALALTAVDPGDRVARAALLGEGRRRQGAREGARDQCGPGVCHRLAGSREAGRKIMPRARAPGNIG
jgi:hypothetical protein